MGAGPPASAGPGSPDRVVGEVWSVDSLHKEMIHLRPRQEKAGPRQLPSLRSEPPCTTQDSWIIYFWNFPRNPSDRCGLWVTDTGSHTVGRACALFGLAPPSTEPPYVWKTWFNGVTMTLSNNLMLGGQTRVHLCLAKLPPTHTPDMQPGPQD